MAVKKVVIMLLVSLMIFTLFTGLVSAEEKSDEKSQVQEDTSVKEKSLEWFFSQKNKKSDSPKEIDVSEKVLPDEKQVREYNEKIFKSEKKSFRSDITAVGGKFFSNEPSYPKWNVKYYGKVGDSYYYDVYVRDVFRLTLQVHWSKGMFEKGAGKYEIFMLKDSLKQNVQGSWLYDIDESKLIGTPSIKDDHCASLEDAVNKAIDAYMMH